MTTPEDSENIAELLLSPFIKKVVVVYMKFFLRVWV
jgi:hypothetical protein